MMYRWLQISARVVCLGAVLGASAALAQPAANGFYVESVTPDAALFYPTDLALAPGGTAYVAHKQGWISVVDPDGTVRSDRFLDVQSEVHSAGDRGLLGIALDPAFPSRPYLYLYYSRLDETSTEFESPFTYGRLERVTAAGPDLAVADPASRVVLLGQSYADAPVGCEVFHAGATVAFAPDGSLLLSTGDGANADVPPDVGGRLPDCFVPARADPANDIGAFRSQRVESLNGKLLRLDPETGLGLPDNPFWTGDANDPASKVWALGFRNPFRLAVRPGDGPLEVAVGDVGWFSYEEINLATGGENFGWPCFEGILPQPNYTASAPLGYECQAAAQNVASPAALWSHYYPERSIPAGLTAQSVTGGAFYDGGAFPETYEGALFVADFASQWLMALRFDGGRVVSAERVLEDVGSIVDVEVDAVDGSILLLDILGGRILRLRNTGAGEAPPVARGEASPQSGAAPLPVTFTADESFDPAGGPVEVAWSFGDGVGAEGGVVEHVYTEPGQYAATLTVTAASGRQTQRILPVRVGVSMPRIEILSPSAVRVEAGDQVRLRAEATDAAEPDESLSVSWEGRIVHNGHQHPGVYTAEGVNALLPIVPHGSPQELTYYTVTATVEDGEGLRASRTVALPVVPSGTVVGRVRPVWGDDGVAELGQTVRLRSLLFSSAPEGVDGGAVEVRAGGTWRAPAFVQSVRAASGTRVLFVETAADAVRVGAENGRPSLSLNLGSNADAARLNLATAGRSEANGVLAATNTGLTLQVDGGPDPTFAYRPLGDAGRAETTVLALLGAVRAGVALTTSLEADAERIELTVDTEGMVRSRDRLGRVDTLAQASLPTRLRLVQEPTDVRAELSEDGAAWTLLKRFAPGSERLTLAGLVAQASTAATARFDSLQLGPVTYPPVQGPEFTIPTIVPNPTTGSAQVTVNAVSIGAYRIEVFDALGRQLSRADRVASEPQTLTVSLHLDSAAPGLYAVRVLHLESGTAAFERLTLIR